MSSSRRILILFFPLSVFVILLLSCSSDEDGLRPSPPSANMIQVDFENASVIEVDSDRHWALLLHNSQSSSGTAIELVNLSDRSVIASLILDYFDVYDIKFVNNNEACFAGRPHGNIGYSVHFFSLSDLTLGTRVMTAGTTGVPGYLSVDSTGNFVYASYGGDGYNDGIFKIRVSNKTLVDADNDGQLPYALDNDLVAGLFSDPSKLFVDHASGKVVASNRTSHFVTIVDLALWGTLDRSSNLAFPIIGTAHLETGIIGLQQMAHGAGVYVLATTQSDNVSYLARFGIHSNGLDLFQSVDSVQWRFNRSSLYVHPREDVFSLFIIQDDTGGIAVGQYRLNNLAEVAGSPHRTRSIPDSSIASFGIDIVSDQLIISDVDLPRLELISIE